MINIHMIGWVLIMGLQFHEVGVLDAAECFHCFHTVKQLDFTSECGQTTSDVGAWLVRFSPEDVQESFRWKS